MPFVEVAASGTITIKPTIPTIKYGPLDDLRGGVADIRRPVEPEEEEEVQSGMEEGVQPEHPPELAEPSPTGDPARGRDGQRQHEEDEREDSGRADGEVDRVGTQLAAPGVPAEEGDRHGAVEQDDGLGESIDFQGRCLSFRRISWSPSSEIGPQIHAGIKVADLLGISVEEERRPPTRSRRSAARSPGSIAGGGRSG